VFPDHFRVLVIDVVQPEENEDEHDDKRDSDRDTAANQQTHCPRTDERPFR
jgi:hypothetical protein